MDERGTEWLFEARQLEKNLVLLSLEIQRVRKRKGSLYVACVDVKKAFNMVDNQVMIEYLRKIGWDDVWVRCLKEMYGEERISIFMGDREVGVIRSNKARL